MSVYILENTIQKYSWGSPETIPTLLGFPNPDHEPFAELWLGAHPKAPSKLVAPGADGPRDLAALIAADPDKFLGARSVRAFGPRLPYLFKLLAIEKPLSIQAHPSLEQAIEGFARENAAGIPLDAPNRNYRDDNHKPEIVCAVTPFRALCGFREAAKIVYLMRAFIPSFLKPQVDVLEAAEPEGRSAALAQFFDRLMTTDEGTRRRVLKSACAKARDFVVSDVGIQDVAGLDDLIGCDPNTLAARTLLRLSEEYPDDIGVLAPLYMNIVSLAPGEALFLPAGVLHAYLSGTGIELMANSDNVLRGGLTPKYVDVKELLSVLSFESAPPNYAIKNPTAPGVISYRTKADEFELSRITLDGELSFPVKGPEILLCLSGSPELRTGDEAPIPLGTGASVFIGADIPNYLLRGRGEIYRATLPTLRKRT
jgi:mannose-6-phosphate isomerase